MNDDQESTILLLILLNIQLLGDPHYSRREELLHKGVHHSHQKLAVSVKKKPYLVFCQEIHNSWCISYSNISRTHLHAASKCLETTTGALHDLMPHTLVETFWFTSSTGVDIIPWLSVTLTEKKRHTSSSSMRSICWGGHCFTHWPTPFLGVPSNKPLQGGSRVSSNVIKTKQAQNSQY